MNRAIFVVVAILFLFATTGFAAEASAPPTRDQIEAGMGLKSCGDLVRGQRDTLGFVVTADQAADVVSTAVELEAEAIATTDRSLGLSPEKGYIGGVCPHDDHLYAGRAYVHLTERITAPRILLIGVFHAARLWNLENVLVFDSFENWHGPWGPIEIDDALRRQLIEAMPDDRRIIDNTMHCREHSLEALLPFLQYRNREVSIVPILVPYARWDRLSQLAEELSSALAGIMEEQSWELGRDVAIVVSSDAVHYGPDFDHAPFGTDAASYQRAVDRDVALARRHLEGDLEAARLEAFENTLVEADDPRTYRIPWCGRFSIPFGLEVLRRVAEENGLAARGHLLRYATSLSEPVLPVEAATCEAGLGFTAPSNLHHWVGYATLGVTARPRPSD